ncbi:helix-turn-helix transcriptional regulator [Halodesulfovibrio spirochaetisodalis]|nr:helix-turn-helix transcriptional regulator [Halodesulfovibrio spirochaetisodalis]
MTHSSCMTTHTTENAQAWAVIMDRIRQEYAAGQTQLSIAQKMGVTKVAVSRWLSEERGGDRTTFGDMIRYAKALNIPFEKLVNLPVTQPANPLTEFDKALGRVLKECAHEAELSIQNLVDQIGISQAHIEAILAGTAPLTGELLHRFCNTVEVGATVLFKKAEKQAAQHR